LRVVGLNPDRSAISGNRLVELALAHQRIAETEMGLGSWGTQFCSSAALLAVHARTLISNWRERDLYGAIAPYRRQGSLLMLAATTIAQTTPLRAALRLLRRFFTAPCWMQRPSPSLERSAPHGVTGSHAIA